MNTERLAIIGEKYWADTAGYKKVDPKTVDGLRLTTEDSSFLLNYRFPTFVAPNLWFHFVNGEAPEYKVSSSSIKLAFQIGEDRDDRPIIWLPAEGAIYVFDATTSAFLLMAYSFVELYECLAVYAEMVEMHLGRDEQRSVRDQFDVTSREWLANKLESLNRCLCQDNTFWKQELNRLKSPFPSDQNYI